MRKPETAEIAFDIAEREAHVRADGPRIEPIPDDDFPAELRALVNNVRAGVGADLTAPMDDYVRMIAKHPDLFRCTLEMGKAIFLGQIAPRERELAILRIAWLGRAPYEWGEHVEIAKRYGISHEEIARSKRGSSDAAWSPHEAAILRGVEELLADQALSDETYDALANNWSETQIIEYLVMVGNYLGIAFVQNTLRVPLAGYNRGLSHT